MTKILAQSLLYVKGYSPSENEEELVRFGAFHPDDLELNRMGDLSERQKVELLFFVVFWLAVAGLDLVLMAFLVSAQPWSYVGTLMPVLWCIFLVTMSIMCVKNAVPFWKDTQDGEVKSVSGLVSKYITWVSAGRSGHIGYCNIKVQDQVFSLNPRFYDLVMDHDDYRLYYSANSKRIINIEPL